MIIGLGSDLVDIRRVERTLEKFGSRFVDRVFGEAEKAKAERRGKVPRGRAATYAKRFAAKEACSKALGTGFRDGVFMKDMVVVNLQSGLPTLVLSGGAAARLVAMTPPGMAAHIHLTMTDDYPLAQAMVVISAEPLAPQPP